MRRRTVSYGKLEADARARMQEHLQHLREGGVRAHATIRIGKRAHEIVRFSREQDFDLMILYSHRLDPADLTRGLLTISHQVAIAADCPVLLLR